MGHCPIPSPIHTFPPGILLDTFLLPFGAILYHFGVPEAVSDLFAVFWYILHPFGALLFMFVSTLEASRKVFGPFFFTKRAPLERKMLAKKVIGRHGEMFYYIFITKSPKKITPPFHIRGLSNLRAVPAPVKSVAKGPSAVQTPKQTLQHIYKTQTATHNMPRISEEKRKKISEQILFHLYTVFPKQIFTSDVAKEVARDEEFAKTILLEMEKKGLIVKVDRNPDGIKYELRLRWRISNKAQVAYSQMQ